MKDKILKLRKEGKTYNEIKNILNCSKGTISYHCGPTQKEKTKRRREKRRENLIIRKVDTFKHTKPKRNILESIRKYQKRDNNAKGGVNKELNFTFNWKDLIEKIGGIDTFCYLSGEKINLYDNTYNFDHITPVSKGGNNSLENLGILHKVVNTMKQDISSDELIDWCIKIIEFNGYNVKKKNASMV